VTKQRKKKRSEKAKPEGLSGYAARRRLPWSERHPRIDYTAPHFVSMTTSCHVGLAKRVADWAEPPRKDR